MKTIRAFVSIPIPEDFLSEYQAGLRRSYNNSNLREQPEEKAHLTIQFLGHITSEQVTQALSVLKAISQKYKAPQIEVENIERLPKSRPHSVVLEIKRSKQLLDLQKDIQAELQTGGIGQVEQRAYYPHITLAKIKDPVRANKPLALIKKSFNASSIDLIQSTLLSSGSRFHVLGSYKFQNAQG